LRIGWVDRHKRYGVVLALIALALQIALAFDHVHLRVVGQGSPAAFSQHAASAQTAPHAPAQFPNDQDGYCAVCASIALASSAFTAAPPQLPVPATFKRVEHRLDRAATLAKPQRLAFRSRAPPVA
jgi:hypothetical protein